MGGDRGQRPTVAREASVVRQSKEDCNFQFKVLSSLKVLPDQERLQNCA